MCTRARLYGRARRSSFGGRGVTNGIRADPRGCAYGSVCGHRASGACGPEMGHTTWHMGRHWMYGRGLRGKVLGHLLGSVCELCMRVWAWDGAHDIAYGLALDG
jgi:hypothetical protein